MTLIFSCRYCDALLKSSKVSEDAELEATLKEIVSTWKSYSIITRSGVVILNHFPTCNSVMSSMLCCY